MVPPIAPSFLQRLYTVSHLRHPDVSVVLPEGFASAAGLFTFENPKLAAAKC